MQQERERGLPSHVRVRGMSKFSIRCPTNWGQRIVDDFGPAQIQRQSVEVVKPRKCGRHERGTCCSDLEQNVEVVRVILERMVMQIR